MLAACTLGRCGGAGFLAGVDAGELSGMTEAEKLTHARKLNIARRHLTSGQMRELIRDQLKATPEQSDRQIAQALGVNHETVGTQRKILEAGGGIRQCSRKASDGRVFHKPVVSVFNPTKREERAMKKPEVVERELVVFLDVVKGQRVFLR